MFLKWDKNKKDAETHNYVFDERGLSEVTVTLTPASGNPTNPIDPTFYPFGSKILNYDERKVYTLAHEFGHVEYAMTGPGAAAIVWEQWATPWQQQQLSRLGTRGFANDPDAKAIQAIKNQDKLKNENQADTRGKVIIDNYRLCLQNKPGC